MPRLDLGYCELSFKPDAKLVSIVRRFVSDFYERMLIDREGIDRVALATHELLENAVKYSSDGETSLRIQIDQIGPKAIVTIQTRNLATAENAKLLQRIVTELEAAEDPFEMYQDVMRRSLLDGDGSRLGLARLRAEAEMRMKIEPGPADEIRLLATTEVALEEAS